MKKSLLLALGLALAGRAGAHSVAISQIIDHPALNEVRRGLQDELQAVGSVKYELENAQGNIAIAQQIAEKFAGLKPDVIVAIGTPAAQAVSNSVQGSIPLVFAAVTDPMAAKLVSAWDKTDGNITGTSDAVPVAKNVELMLEVVPQLKSLGTLYNPGEANSVASVAALKEALRAKNIELVEAPATKTSEVQEAAATLVDRVQALYLVQDNTAVSALASVLEVGETAKIPVFTADTALVQQGAVGAVSFDYYQVGRTAGRQVAAILKGKPVSELPVQTPEREELLLNSEAAAKMGVRLPEALRARAQLVP